MATYLDKLGHFTFTHDRISWRRHLFGCEDTIPTLRAPLRCGVDPSANLHRRARSVAQHRRQLLCGHSGEDFHRGGTTRTFICCDGIHDGEGRPCEPLASPSMCENSVFASRLTETTHEWIYACASHMLRRPRPETAFGAWTRNLVRG